MPTIKENIISKIHNVNNEQLLTEVYRILQADEYEFTEKEIQLLHEADSSIDNGNYSTQQEVENKMNQWLKNLK